jgi:hypothetical protein
MLGALSIDPVLLDQRALPQVRTSLRSATGLKSEPVYRHA